MKVLKLIGAIVLCEAIGGLGGLATSPNITSWYAPLAKPSFTPPNWLFAPAWGILYALMGIALFLVWESSKENKKAAYAIFFAQLALNLAWSLIFFGLHAVTAAFVEIVVLWILILFTILVFRKISKAAAYLLIPYILWVTFASALNLAVLILN